MGLESAEQQSKIGIGCFFWSQLQSGRWIDLTVRCTLCSCYRLTASFRIQCSGGLAIQCPFWRSEPGSLSRGNSVAQTVFLLGSTQITVCTLTRTAWASSGSRVQILDLTAGRLKPCFVSSCPHNQTWACWFGPPDSDPGRSRSANLVVTFLFLSLFLSSSHILSLRDGGDLVLATSVSSCVVLRLDLTPQSRFNRSLTSDHVVKKDWDPITEKCCRISSLFLILVLVLLLVLLFGEWLRVALPVRRLARWWSRCYGTIAKCTFIAPRSALLQPVLASAPTLTLMSIPC